MLAAEGVSQEEFYKLNDEGREAVIDSIEEKQRDARVPRIL